jgi:GxxExxY protein
VAWTGCRSGGLLAGCYNDEENHESTRVRKHEKEGKREEGKPMAHDFEELSGRILAAAVEVHRALGPGFLEGIYQKAMEVALGHRGLAFERQKEIHVFFEGVDVGLHRLDLLVEAQIIVELKAIKAFEEIHYAQLRSYLKATGLHVGLLLNFSAPTLAIKRVVC